MFLIIQQKILTKVLKMAKGYKSGGKDFKRGWVSNPNGRPKVPEEYKKLQKLNADQFKGMVAKFALMTVPQMLEYLESGEVPVFEAMIGKIIKTCIETGDHAKLNFLLDRTIGKVKEQVEVNVAPQIIYKTTMTDDGRMVQDILTPQLLEGEIVDTGNNNTATESTQ